jgi:7-cyano-7-deazaguanine synthase
MTESNTNKIFDVAKAYSQPDLIGVMLSGGIDSTTVLFDAMERAPSSSIVAISFDYGQRHRKEIDAAASICEQAGVNQHILNLKDIIPNTMLKDPSQVVPNTSYGELTGVSPTYVPFRNGLMMAAATSFLVGELEEYHPGGVAHLYCGIHAEDAAAFAYPDCTPEFFGSAANMVWMGTYGKVRLIAPFVFSSKTDIVRRGSDLDVPYELTWSCYKGEAYHCGICPTCRARKQAFEDANIGDPTYYAASGDVTDTSDEMPF